MKHIKIYFLIFSIMFTFSNIKVHAKEEKEEHILVISELPWYFDIQTKADQVQIRFIPSNLYLGKYTTKNKEETKNTIEQFLNVTYTHVLYIDMNTFYQDTNLKSMNPLDHNTTNLFKHLHTVSDTLSIPMLLRYQTYISADLNVMDYISYYKLFNNSNTKFSYAYMRYMNLDDIAIPLDNTFHTE